MNLLQMASLVPPSGFVNLHDLDPSIIVHLRYAGSDNFVGRPAPGYLSSTSAWMTREAALALVKVQERLLLDGYSLVVYDAFRPTRAVAFWCAWAESERPEDDIMRSMYYPRLAAKTQLFERGYVARRSGHSRGSTVDVTLIRVGDSLNRGPYSPLARPLLESDASHSVAHPGVATVPFLDDGTLDMYTSWDLLDLASHHDTPLVPPEYLARRNTLRAVMEECGWQGTPREWWHWTLRDEPYPDTYFDFDIV